MSGKTRRRGGRKPQSRRPQAPKIVAGAAAVKVVSPDLIPVKPAARAPQPPQPPQNDMGFPGGKPLITSVSSPIKMRFWCWLGFGEKYAATAETPEGYEPDIHTIASIGLLDWKDRLRVLISGRVFTHQLLQTDAKVTRIAYTANVSVLAPGYLPAIERMKRIIDPEEMKRAAARLGIKP